MIQNLNVHVLSKCFLAGSSKRQTSTGVEQPSLSGAHARRQQSLLTSGHKGNIINCLTEYLI